MSSLLNESKEYVAGLQSLARYLELNRTELLKQTSAYGNGYKDKRGSMVVDVIASRQRQYNPRVLSIIAGWEEFAGGHSLALLADKGCPSKQFGLRRGEEEAMVLIAENLLNYGKSLGISDENEICGLWSKNVGELRFASELDPIVGSVSGVGPALFNYMRMLSGADAIKPDVRVKSRLKEFGFPVPKRDAAVLYLCEAIARDLKIDLIELDQLLWRNFA